MIKAKVKVAGSTVAREAQLPQMIEESVGGTLGRGEARFGTRDWTRLTDYVISQAQHNTDYYRLAVPLSGSANPGPAELHKIMRLHRHRCPVS